MVMQLERYCKSFSAVDKRWRRVNVVNIQHGPSLGDYRMSGYEIVVMTFVTTARERAALTEPLDFEVS